MCCGLTAQRPGGLQGKHIFSMTYGAETMILAEIGLCSMKVSDFTPEKNDASLVKELDLQEERREMDLNKLANYQQNWL